MIKERYRWTILGLTYLCMLGFAFTLQSVPPILTLIIDNMRLTHTQAGLLMGLFALPPVVLSVFIGSFSDYLGTFKVGIVSLILIIAGMSILASSRSFFQAGLGRVVAGIGAATIAIVSSQMISQWFRGREIGTAMGIFNTAMPVGTIVCFTVFGRVGERLGFRVPLFISAGVGVLGLIAFLILHRPAPLQSGAAYYRDGEKVRGLFSKILKIGAVMWLVGLSWMWFNAAAISFSTFAPDFFISKGYSIGYAGFLVSLLMWGSLVLSPLIGHLVDRFGNNELFIALGGVVMGISIYLVSKVNPVLLPMAFMSLAVAFVPAPVFSIPSKIFDLEILGLVFGVLFMMSSLGMFFGPYVAGFVRDRTGSYSGSFLLMLVFALFVSITAIIVRVKMKRRGV